MTWPISASRPCWDIDALKLAAPALGPAIIPVAGAAAVARLLPEIRAGAPAQTTMTRVFASERRDGGWLGRELARWQWLTGRPRGLCSAGFPSGCATSVAMVSVLRLQLPPVDPCMRFSRTRLTDVLHRRCSV